MAFSRAISMEKYAMDEVSSVTEASRSASPLLPPAVPSKRQSSAKQYHERGGLGAGGRTQGGRKRGIRQDGGLDLVPPDLDAGDAGSGQAHDGGQCGVPRRHHRRDEPALAVPRERDAPAVDPGPRAQVLNLGRDVVRLVEGGRRLVIPGGFPHATVIDAGHRDAMARDGVRDATERHPRWTTAV